MKATPANKKLDMKVLRMLIRQSWRVYLSMRRYFEDSRLDLFPRLRRLAFSWLMRSDECDIPAKPSELVQLMARADAGSELDEQRALTLITSPDGPPADFPAYVAFLSPWWFCRELIDCVLLWANSVLPDRNAVAFQNASLRASHVRKQDPTSEFVLRQDVYNLLMPSLKAAMAPTNGACAAVKAALISTSNVSLQRFVFEYLEQYADS
jgi:hypothetical protein